MKHQPTGPRGRVWHWAAVLLAVLLLNIPLTVHNVWPTPAVHWTGELSVELAALLLVLSVSNAAGWRTPRPVLVGLSLLMVLFGLGRYAEVTAPALYGREVNLYWDVPQLGAVAGMLVRVASPWIVTAIVVGAVVVLALLYLMARWSWGRIDAVLHARRGARLGFGLVAAVLVVCYLVQQISDSVPRLPRFSIPVSQTYATQIGRFAAAFSGRAARSLPPSPPLQSSLATLGGSDVLLVFMESYGRSTYDRPEFQQALVASRARLDAAIRDTHRGVVSAFVTSPTFSSGSVLAHLSLLSGVEVRDPDHYAALMMQRRPTLVSTFKSAGYRTLAVMPGLRDPWPEGAFYGFDHIYGADGLDYHGPAFGWWRIPDQFSLAALDARELRPRPRQPLFVFFPTVSTHMPFEPVPPLQADWQRILSPQPFDAGPLHDSLLQTPVWTDLGRAYTHSVNYFTDVLANWLRARGDEQFVLIVLGDHQPAASVSGEGASWDVPVHVIASQPAILEALQADGFRPGLEPAPSAAGPMSKLGPWLLAAFGKPTAAQAQAPAAADVR